MEKGVEGILNPRGKTGMREWDGPKMRSVRGEVFTVPASIKEYRGAIIKEKKNQKARQETGGVTSGASGEGG